MSNFNAGHLRAVIALLFSIGIIAGMFTGHVTQETFTMFATMALTFYFSTENRQGKSPPIETLSTVGQQMRRP